MRNIFWLVLCIFILSGYGCSIITHSQQLFTLKSVGDSQAQIERYLDRQLEGFTDLVEDINSESLEAGISRKKIISRYFEPVLVKEAEGIPSIKEILLYRHPTECFTSDRVYLYIDESSKLSYWEYEPYEGIEDKEGE